MGVGGISLRPLGISVSMANIMDVKFADSDQLIRCANYPHAPRGGLNHLPEEYRWRFSFCCDRDPPKAD
jgi:hypothetical protein